MSGCSEKVVHFEVTARCSATGARLGRLSTAHGVVPTPAFLPVGSRGTVKALTPDELRDVGVSMVLANVYHLYLRPGVDIIERAGGLHKFMKWGGPILTDSGGYQVFSLARLCRVDDEGVVFRSHIDGSEHRFTPEAIIELQERMGADIIMPLDHCPPSSASVEGVVEAVKRTYRWAVASRRSHKKPGQMLFGIVQGGLFPELRQQAAREIVSLGFDGYAIGGLSLGESKSVMWSVVAETVTCLPEEKPRYLMGVGSPEDIVEGVSHGIDLFDSALPTRVARNGALFTVRGRQNITKANFRYHDSPVDPECDCYTCRTFPAAYLHHLFRCDELLVYRLATIHNVRFMMRLMERIRETIKDNTFADFKKDFLSSYQVTNEEMRVAQKQKWLSKARDHHGDID